MAVDTQLEKRYGNMVAADALPSSLAVDIEPSANQIFVHHRERKVNWTGYGSVCPPTNISSVTSCRCSRLCLNCGLAVTDA